MSLNNLKQFNPLKNSDGNSLDLVLSGNPHINVSQPDNILSKIDAYHPPLLIEMYFPFIKFLKPKPFTKRNFTKADYTKINKEIIEIDWDKILNDCNSVDEMLDIFYNKLQSIIEQLVASKRYTSGSYPQWFSQNLVKAMKEKDKYRRLWTKFHNPRDKISFIILRNRCHSFIKLDYRNYLNKIECSLKSTNNTKYFWSYIKSKKKN